MIVSWTRPPGGTASEADGKSGCALGTAGVEDQGFSGKLTLTLSAGNLRAVAGSSDLGHQAGRENRKNHSFQKAKITLFIVIKGRLTLYILSYKGV